MYTCTFNVFYSAEHEKSCFQKVKEKKVTQSHRIVKNMIHIPLHIYTFIYHGHLMGIPCITFLIDGSFTDQVFLGGKQKLWCAIVHACSFRTHIALSLLIKTRHLYTQIAGGF